MARRDDPARSQRLRQQVAREAARLLAEHGGDDVARARRKAAAALGVRDESMLPGGDEIMAALRGHRELFGGTAEAGDLRRLRQAALEAMAFFDALHPRLVGAVLAGDAAADSAVRLHLHADDPDAVVRLLLERGIPARQGQRGVRLDRGRVTDVPAWTFVADGVAFELLQLPASALRQAPRDPLDDRPLARASAAALRRLLDGQPE